MCIITTTRESLGQHMKVMKLEWTVVCGEDLFDDYTTETFTYGCSSNPPFGSVIKKEWDLDFCLAEEFIQIYGNNGEV